MYSRIIALTFGRVGRTVHGQSVRNLHVKSSNHQPQPSVTSFSPLNSFRTYCSNMADNKVVTYEEVVTYKDKPEVYLIDVREPKELQETGIIPASINIPLGDVITTLKDGNPSDFKKKYGKDFPDTSKQLVFLCMMGGRATKAMDQAIQLGFTNSKVYKGSWLDWESHQSK